MIHGCASLHEVLDYFEVTLGGGALQRRVASLRKKERKKER